MYKTVLFLCGAAFVARAQNFDTSGTAGLSGPYFFRYVVFSPDSSGNIQEGCSVTGTMTFDGQGAYTTSNAQSYDSAGSSAGSCGAPGTGTYGVQSNGLTQLDNPLFAATLFGTLSQPVLTASSTEDGYYDLFIAVQAPVNQFGNKSLSGTYTAGTMDFLNSQSAFARQGYFTFTADGNGNIAAFTVNGSAANLSAGAVTQTISGSTYAAAGTGGATLTIPLASGATERTQIVSGTKALFVSADGNYVLGGSTTGTDMIFGFRTSAGTGSNSLFSGTYFMAGMDADTSQNSLDAFYGAINANGSGTAVWHERFDDVVNIQTYDDTFTSSVTIGADGSYNDGTYTTIVGAGGRAVLLIGSGQQFSLNIGVKAPVVTPSSGVWINPVGITNAANYTPITNAYAPGELVNLYGSFGVGTQTDQAIPIPTTLANTQVLVNGQAAPVYLVSANQITALIPYEVAGQYFATFQVSVNGAMSNAVTVYVDNTSPGVYSLNQNGIGTAAILHSNYTTVTDSSPATPGETVSLYMNGLGLVSPLPADGAAGPSNPLSNVTDANFAVYLDDGVDTAMQASATFAGLAPGYPGLYQVNFTVPTTGLGNGHVFVVIDTNEGQTEMATISLTGFAHAAAQIAPRGAKIKGARATRSAKAKRRRALPKSQLQ